MKWLIRLTTILVLANTVTSTFAGRWYYSGPAWGPYWGPGPGYYPGYYYGNGGAYAAGTLFNTLGNVVSSAITADALKKSSDPAYLAYQEERRYRAEAQRQLTRLNKDLKQARNKLTDAINKGAKDEAIQELRQHIKYLEERIKDLLEQ